MTPSIRYAFTRGGSLQWTSYPAMVRTRSGPPMPAGEPVHATGEHAIRALAGDDRRFTGYAAVFDSLSEPLREFGVAFRERIAPGAFGPNPGADRNVRMFLNHNSDMLLASSRNNTLRLTADRVGLRAEADLPDTTAGRDAATLVARGDIDSMSFGFSVIEDRWLPDPAPDGLRVRELVRVDLFEVSPVTSWPAYPATSADLRNEDPADVRLMRESALRMLDRVDALSRQHLGRELTPLERLERRAAGRQMLDAIEWLHLHDPNPRHPAAEGFLQ